MAIDDLLAAMERRAADTPDTSRNPCGVSGKPAPLLACTPDTLDTPRNDNNAKNGQSIDVSQLAASLAAEFGTTPEYCLSLLDADDRRAIAAGSDPGRAGAWRTAVHLAAAQPPTAPATALDGEGAIYPAPVVCWTPAGFPVAVEARDEKHAGQLRRWNPRPARLALASTSAGLRS